MSSLGKSLFFLSASALLVSCGRSDKAEETAGAAEEIEQSGPQSGAETIVQFETAPAAQFTARLHDKPPLGLPFLPKLVDNPTTTEKVRLGEVLFNDTRFSSTGEVSCATCHDPAKAFTDSPLSVSEGIDGLTGTRNAPTVINAAYFASQFWDGRRPSLELQSQDPFLNPVEMNLPSHEPILEIVRSDEAYGELFQAAYGISGGAITMDHVSNAIAAFERVVISGGSPFDRWRYGGEEDAISEEAKRGFDVFINQGRCVSCHTISQTYALFTDNKFHNLGIGFKRIEDDTEKVVGEFLRVADTDREVDEAVLGDANISEIGRFAVSREMQDIGQFKTPTLRNVAATAPYMHDGSLKTLREVVDFYNTTISPHEDQEQPPNPFQSGGIRPLDLSEQQIEDLIAFMETLTSPEFQAAAEISLKQQAEIDAASAQESAGE